MSWNKKYKDEDLRIIPSKPVLTDFGKAENAEDRVEFHVYSQDNKTKLYSDIDIGTWTVAEGGIEDSGNINQDSVVFLDIHKDIREFASSGFFNVKYNFFRTVVGSPDYAINDLYIDEISATRSEIRLKIHADAAQHEKDIFEDFGDKLSLRGDVEHWVDMHVNFGNGIAPLAVNWQLDKITTKEFPFSLVVKLYEPLPETIKVNDTCWIVQEMLASVLETIVIEAPLPVQVVNVLGPANFSIGQDNMGTGTSDYYAWDDITNAKEEILQKVLDRYFSSSLDEIRLAVDYRKYEHFVRFGSAKERIKNFHYKLSQIEYFDKEIYKLSAGSIATASGNSSITGSSAYLIGVKGWKDKKNDIVSNFDGYEKFLHQESSSWDSASLGDFYDSSWPKYPITTPPGVWPNSGQAPYRVMSVTSSQVIDWYQGAYESASLFDTQNPHSLLNTAIPLHLHEVCDLEEGTPQNEEYVKFVDMMGHFYDNIYLYISAMPELWDRHNALDARLTQGGFSGSDMLSKDLLYMGLQNLGYEQCMKNEDADLWTYVLGTDASGSFGDELVHYDTNDWMYWDAPDNQFASASYIVGTSNLSHSKIYASDWYQTSHSVAKEDIRLEIAKRLLNNLPHLLTVDYYYKRYLVN